MDNLRSLRKRCIWAITRTFCPIGRIKCPRYRTDEYIRIFPLLLPLFPPISVFFPLCLRRFLSSPLLSLHRSLSPCRAPPSLSTAFSLHRFLYILFFWHFICYFILFIFLAYQCTVYIYIVCIYLIWFILFYILFVYELFHSRKKKSLFFLFVKLLICIYIFDLVYCA